MNEKRHSIIVTVLLLAGLPNLGWGTSAQKSLRQGNRLYNEGNYNQAIGKYGQALIDRPEALEPKFNKANSYYRLDDLAQAIDLYREVAAKSKDMKLVAGAKYNLGNCYFKQGSKQKDSDLQKALEDLKTSIDYWRQTLDIDPSNEKAAKNIEVARLLIKDIIDQLNKQMQQQQEQAAKQKQLQDKLKELLEQQKALAEQTQKTKNQADKGEILQQQASEDFAQQAKEQSQLEKQTEQTSQEMQQQDPNNPQPPQMQQTAEELDRAASNQKDAREKLNLSDGAGAKQSQDRAIEHIENALKTLSQTDKQGQQQNQQQQQQNGQDESQQEPNQPQEQQQQEQQKQQQIAPDTTAQEILDREQRQWEMRQLLQRAPWQKVEKDW